jgi:hypothetical protein
MLRAFADPVSIGPCDESRIAKPASRSPGNPKMPDPQHP